MFDSLPILIPDSLKRPSGFNFDTLDSRQMNILKVNNVIELYFFIAPRTGSNKMLPIRTCQLNHLLEYTCKQYRYNSNIVGIRRTL